MTGVDAFCPACEVAPETRCSDCAPPEPKPSKACGLCVSHAKNYGFANLFTTCATCGVEICKCPRLTVATDDGGRRCLECWLAENPPDPDEPARTRAKLDRDFGKAWRRARGRSL